MDAQLPVVIISLAIGAGITWVVYTALIWLLLRVQGLTYTIAGLIASTIVATLVSMIPHVGFVLSGIVLIACLAKVTKASVVPDLIFTVLIANALMFCFSMFVLTGVTPDLRPLAEGVTRHSESPENPGEVDAAEPEEEEENQGSGSLAGILDKARATLVKARERGTAPTLNSSTNSGPQILTHYEFSSDEKLVLKGISYGTKIRTAMIGCGSQLRTVGEGDVFHLETSDGSATMQCEEITRTSVRIKLADGNSVELKLGP